MLTALRRCVLLNSINPPLPNHPPCDQASLDQLFFKARTADGFLDKPVPLALLQQVYDIVSMGATSMNTQPARYV